MKQESDQEDHDDSEKGKDQRIRKPTLTPVGESQSKAYKGLFLSNSGFLSFHVHTRSFRFGSNCLSGLVPEYARHCSACLAQRPRLDGLCNPFRRKDLFSAVRKEDNTALRWSHDLA